jgi:deazaflavin-dependent oxidoreductase (nitroreductase family)
MTRPAREGNVGTENRRTDVRGVDMTARRTPTRASAATNGLVDLLLRSQVGGALGRTVLLLTVTGRRTGRRYRLPVQYARDGDLLWIVVGDHAGKTWWRNLTTAATVEVRLHGARHHATARVVDGGAEPDLAVDGLRVWSRQFPLAARSMAADDDAGLYAAAKRTVLVRVQLDPGSGTELPRAVGESR